MYYVFLKNPMSFRQTELRFFQCEPRQDRDVAAISILKFVHYVPSAEKGSDFLGYTTFFQIVKEVF